MLRFDMLRYDMQGAYYAGDTEHPVYVMKDLGITYIKAVPQSIGDCWCFFVCDVPLDVELPSYIIPTKTNPAKWAGFGLSDEDAMELADLLRYDYQIEDGCLVGGINQTVNKSIQNQIDKTLNTNDITHMNGYDPSKLSITIGNHKFTGYTEIDTISIKKEK